MRYIRLAAVILFAVCISASAWAQSPVYKVSRKAILGGEGGWDYLTYDSSAHRLYIARSTRVMVVDVDSGTLVGEVAGTAGVHGVALVPELNRGVSSNGRDDSATIFDLKTLQPVATVKTGGKPDAILFDAATGHVVTFNGRTNNATVIDPKAGVVVATIALPGRPETGVSDGQGMIYVNLEDRGAIAAIDMKQRKVVQTSALEGCTEPTGLAMDTKNRRLFSVCHNGVLVVVNADSGKNLQKLPIGQKVDAAAFDAETKLIFTSNGEGTISIIQQDTPDQYRTLQTVVTQLGAKTMALDRIRHSVYTVATLGEVGKSPTAAAGKFGLLTIEP